MNHDTTSIQQGFSILANFVCYCLHCKNLCTFCLNLIYCFCICNAWHYDFLLPHTRTHTRTHVHVHTHIRTHTHTHTVYMHTSIMPERRKEHLCSDCGINCSLYHLTNYPIHVCHCYKKVFFISHLFLCTSIILV